MFFSGPKEQQYYKDKLRLLDGLSVRAVILVGTCLPREKKPMVFESKRALLLKKDSLPPVL